MIEVLAETDCSSLRELPGCPKNAVFARVNGQDVDLTSSATKGTGITFITTDDETSFLTVLQHSTAHVLAYALKKIDKNIQLAIGPAIENGFYYDVKSARTFSTEELTEVESIMREIINAKLPFRRKVVAVDEAIRLFEEANEQFKVEMIKDLGKETVSLYYLGDEFVDLCRGPHVPSTSFIPVDAFKLTAISGSYWRGDHKRDVLQRFYGTVWPSKKQMNAYFSMLEEAAARDHRKLGVELGIFHIDEEAVGSVFWLKNGCVLFGLVKEYIAKTIKKYGYFQVQTPQLMDKSLWVTSGHWDKFRENMFVVQDEDKTMAVKPMNCPGHIIIYKNGAVKSYRDLPIRMAEFGICHRNESSGSLHGLMRLRAFMQDDGHIFCRRDQIISETQAFCTALKEVYAKFGFTSIAVKFSDRPVMRAGSDEVWDIAEKALKDAADASGLEYTINKGEGAFYGPKLEFVLKDSLGRDWQCGTLQVDFVLPERFGLHYIDSNGEKQQPVMIHRAMVGSIERFIGILIESYAGRFPFWLAPVQIAICSVTDAASDYAGEVYEHLDNLGFRCVLDTNNEKISYKVRQHSSQKIPTIVILGEKECSARSITIRQLGSCDNISVALTSAGSFFKSLCK